MTFPTSSAVPWRINAVGSSKLASAGRLWMLHAFCIKGVNIAPGATAFTRTSLPPFSLAAARVRPIMPCFLASYAAWFAKPGKSCISTAGREVGCGKPGTSLLCRESTILSQ
jgi:hypothetical protein